MTTLQAKQVSKSGAVHGGVGHNDADDGFSDLHPAYSELQAMAESNRCLYCYDAPCVTACPTSIDIPSFIRKISTGNPDGAAKTILSANIMGAPVRVPARLKCCVKRPAFAMSPKTPPLKSAACNDMRLTI